MEYILNLAYTALVKQHFSKLIVNLLLKIRYFSSFIAEVSRKSEKKPGFIKIQRLKLRSIDFHSDWKPKKIVG